MLLDSTPCLIAMAGGPEQNLEETAQANPPGRCVRNHPARAFPGVLPQGGTLTGTAPGNADGSPAGGNENQTLHEKSQQIEEYGP